MPAMVMAGEYDLTVDRVKIDTGDFVKEWRISGAGYALQGRRKRQDQRDQ